MKELTQQEIDYVIAVRCAAMMKACRGLSTAQLQAMNDVAPGSLATAYEVCSDLRETFGAALDNDEGIAGSDAVDALAELAPKINAVLAWALNNPEAEEILHPQESAS